MRGLGTVSLTLTLILGIAAAGSAQVGRIAGIVRDEAGRPVKGATITAHNPDQSPSTFTASSDEKGRFAMIGLRRGDWKFVIQAPGFETARTATQISTLKPNAPLDIRLLRGALAAPPGPLAGISASDIQRRIDSAESAAAAGNTAAAIAAYRELLERVPALTSIYLRIGALYEQQQDPQSALAAYRRLEQLEPGNTAAAGAVERLMKK
jgi:Carboxypeptidase regulatory-like domain/Tetratricopeptide repeat